MKEEIKDKDKKVEERKLYTELRDLIVETRDKHTKQLQEIKDKIERNKAEAEVLDTLQKKLQGAIEAGNFYAKGVLPTNNPK